MKTFEGAEGAATTPDPRRWLALCVIGLTQLMIVLDASIVNIALPHAQADLGMSSIDRQWVITSYTLAFGGLLLLGGRIADYQGRKRMLIIGLLGFATASALGGAAQNAGMLFAARGLQGAFGAVMAPAALALITTTFTEPHERAKAFGVFGAIAGGGAAIGLIIGGILTEYTSWRWCLYVNVPVAIIAAAAAVPLVHESRAQGDRRYDILGAVLVTAGLALLVYGFTEAGKPVLDANGRAVGTVGWTDPVTLVCLFSAAALLVGFFVWERITASPLLPLRVILDRNRGGSYLVFLLLGAGLLGMFLFLTYYFQVQLGYSPLKAGFAFLPFSLGIILSAGLASQLLPRFGPKPLMLTGLSMGIVAMLYLTQITLTSSYLTHVLPSEIVMSMGLALVFIPTASTALIGVAPHDAGVASAVLNAGQQVGGSLGTGLLNSVFFTVSTAFAAAHAGSIKDPQELANLASIHGYHVTFLISAGLFTVALIITAALIRARRTDLPAEQVVAVA
ncbi:MAG TPA: MFS transporter [Actinomycetes bacterium]|nr:MFS transporter [Actinomycetes bacterium]